MKNAEIRTIIFNQDGKEIENVQKGPAGLTVSREDIKARIAQGEPVVEITAFDNEKEVEIEK